MEEASEANGAERILIRSSWRRSLLWPTLPLGAALVGAGLYQCVTAPYSFSLPGLLIMSVGALIPWRYHRFGTELSAAGVRKTLLFRRGKPLPWADIAEIQVVSTRLGSHPRLLSSDGTRITLHEPSSFKGADAEFDANMAVLNEWWERHRSRPLP